MATPGMRELLSVGKVWELSQHKRRTDGADAYDLVIVDSPAAGHGVGILQTPRSFAEIARVGPDRPSGRRDRRDDRRPRVHRRGGGRRRRGDAGQRNPVAARRARRRGPANSTPRSSTPATRSDSAPAEPEQLEKARRRSRSPLAGAALDAALSEHARAQIQREQLERLREGLGTELVELPYLFTEQIGEAEIEELSDSLGRGLARLESIPVSG